MRSDVAMSGEIGGHFRLVHVDADADDGVVDAIGLGVHLGEDAAEFLAADEQVVGPANVGERGRVSSARRRARRGRDQREQRRVRRGNRRPQQNRARRCPRIFSEIHVRPARPRPAVCSSARTTAPCGSPARPRCMATVLVESVLKKWIDAAREGRAVEAVAAGAAGRECRACARCDSRCAGGPSRARRARAAFRSSARRLARDADFLGDFRAADDDRGVFREQRQQRVDAPVGGAGQVAIRALAWAEHEDTAEAASRS